MISQVRPLFGALVFVGAPDQRQKQSGEVDLFAGVANVLADMRHTGDEWFSQVLPNPLSLHVSCADRLGLADDIPALLDRLPPNGQVLEVVTRGQWATSREVITQTMKQLAGRVHHLLLFVTPNDCETRGVNWIEELIQECRSSGIKISITCFVDERRNLHRAIFELPSVSSDTIMIRVTPALPDDYLGELVPKERWFPDHQSGCRSRFYLTVTSEGDLYPCIRGVGLPDLWLGNVRVTPLVDLLRAALASERLADLATCGPVQLLKDVSGSPGHSRGYHSPCAFHRHVLNRSTSSAQRFLAEGDIR